MIIPNIFDAFYAKHKCVIKQRSISYMYAIDSVGKTSFGIKKDFYFSIYATV